MEPKINKDHGSGTLIASLQALLSKAISLEIFQSLRSLLTDSPQVSLGLPLPLFSNEIHNEKKNLGLPQRRHINIMRRRNFLGGHVR